MRQSVTVSSVFFCVSLAVLVAALSPAAMAADVTRPDRIPDLTVGKSGNDVVLSWSPFVMRCWLPMIGWTVRLEAWCCAIGGSKPRSLWTPRPV